MTQVKSIYKKVFANLKLLREWNIEVLIEVKHINMFLKSV